MEKARLPSPAQILEAVETLASRIAARHSAEPSPLLLGIANGGAGLCPRLSALLAARTGHPWRHGVLDVSFHRDDLHAKPIPREVAATSLPAAVDGATVILVDDVLHSGRTVKAALDELFDHGRPAAVELAVLIDRGARSLPFSADYCGLRLQVPAGHTLKVRVPATGNPTVELRKA